MSSLRTEGVSADAGTISADGAVCGLCGEPMPPGEQMFQYHGYSGPCPPRKHPFAPKPVSPRQQQNRDAQARWRARRRLRVVTRRLELEPEWLDALETRKYLDPFDRTIAKAEVSALKRFLQDHLGGKHDFADTRRD
jgi:hypothetical protein